MLINKLFKEKLIHPPKYINDNTHYLVEMGSVAYGVAGSSSDHDLYGFCIPPKHIIFPHINGIVYGFDDKYERFEQWQEHHVYHESSKQEYDFSIYNIVKYFKLCMDNNPNMVDSLFVPQRNILHCTSVGTLVRENRRLFLHKGCWHKFKGYAYQQLKKLTTKDHEGLEELKKFEDDNRISHSVTYHEAMNGDFSFSDSNGIFYKGIDNPYPEIVSEYQNLYTYMMQKGKRSERVKIYGFDTKFAYHIYRLMSEVEQILLEGDLTLDREDRREVMKAIRVGDWDYHRIIEYFSSKEKDLEELYLKSKLQYSPPINKIRELLLNCIEHHYGSIDNCINREDKLLMALRDISNIVNGINEL